MSPMEITSWRDPLLPLLVDHWNRSFRLRPNFFEIVPDDWRERVTENLEARPRFDSEGLFLALENDRVVGLAHAVPRDEDETDGYLAFLHVEESHRRQGIGTALHERCRAHLALRKTFRIDGQCLTPFYGNVQGPFLPWWGSPEGVGILADDATTIGFLRRRGHAPRHEAVSLEVDLTRPDSSSTASSHATPSPPAEGVLTRLFENSSPILGATPFESAPFTRGEDFLTWAALADGLCVGVALFYPMERAHPGKWGIYHLEVDPRARGRGVGRTLLACLLATLRDRAARRCEVLSIPDLSPGAIRLYERAGFHPVRRWTIF